MASAAALPAAPYHISSTPFTSSSSHFPKSELINLSILELETSAPFRRHLAGIILRENKTFQKTNFK